MKTADLLARIKSGDLSVRNISTEDFRMLMENPETRSYGLTLCGRAYYMKAAQSLNQHMDKINLNDDLNRQIVMETYNLVRMDNQGQIYINKLGCAMLFQNYFTQAFLSMWDMDKGVPNVPQMIMNFFNIRRDIRIIKINNAISEEADRIKAKYITSDPGSKDNFPATLERGWRKLQEDLEHGDLMDDLDYYEGVEEFFEMAVSTVGSLEALFSDLEKDLEHLKGLLKKRQEIYNKEIK